MDRLTTTRELADALGVSPRMVLIRAAKRGVSPIGVLGRVKVWAPDAARKLKAR